MAYELELEKLDGLDDGVKSFYTEKDGKFVLNPVVAGLQTENAAIKHKNDELLNETKTAKRARQEAERVAADAATEAAKKNNDYKQLYESSLAQLEQEREGRTRLEKNIADEKKNNAAMKLAKDLASDGANADLLAEFIARRLDHVDGGLKVLDRDGKLTVSSLDDLKREFANDAKYKSLVKGNGASGGGAAGGDKSGGAGKTLSRVDFEKLTPSDRAEFTKSGGTVF